MPSRHWAAAFAWMALILAFSTETFSFCNTLSLLEAIIVRVMPAHAATDVARANARTRTGAHVLEYAVLAVLLLRALVADRHSVGRAVAIALALCIAWAVVDEAHQAREPSRKGKVTDVVLDAVSGALGAAVWLAVGRGRAARAERRRITSRYGAR